MEAKNTEKVQVMLPPEEYQKCKELAKLQGLSLSSWFRALAFKYIHPQNCK